MRHSRRRAQGEELDPLSPAHQIETGINLYWARRYDEAIAQFRRVLGVNPQFNYARFFLALVLIQKQQYDEALSAMDEPGAGGSLQQETLRGYIQAVTGQQAEAREGLDRLTLLSRTQNVSPWHSAIIHIGLGEHDRALDLIEQAYRDRDWQVRMVACGANSRPFALASPVSCARRQASLKTQPPFTPLMLRRDYAAGLKWSSWHNHTTSRFELPAHLVHKTSPD